MLTAVYQLFQICLWVRHSFEC